MSLSPLRKTYSEIVVVTNAERGNDAAEFSNAQIRWTDDDRLIVSEESMQSEFPKHAVQQVLKYE